MSLATASKGNELAPSHREVRTRTFFLLLFLALQSTKSSFTYICCRTESDSIGSLTNSRNQQCTNTWTRPAVLKVSFSHLKTSSSSNLSKNFVTVTLASIIIQNTESNVHVTKNCTHLVLKICVTVPPASDLNQNIVSNVQTIKNCTHST